MCHTLISHYTSCCSSRINLPNQPTHSPAPNPANDREPFYPSSSAVPWIPFFPTRTEFCSQKSQELSLNVDTIYTSYLWGHLQANRLSERRATNSNTTHHYGVHTCPIQFSHRWGKQWGLLAPPVISHRALVLYCNAVTSAAAELPWHQVSQTTSTGYHLNGNNERTSRPWFFHFMRTIQMCLLNVPTVDYGGQVDNHIVHLPGIERRSCHPWTCVQIFVAAL